MLAFKWCQEESSRGLLIFSISSYWLQLCGLVLITIISEPQPKRKTVLHLTFIFQIGREGTRSCMVFSSKVCFGTFLFPLICSNPDTPGSLWASLQSPLHIHAIIRELLVLWMWETTDTTAELTGMLSRLGVSLCTEVIFIYDQVENITDEQAFLSQ